MPVAGRLSLAQKLLERAGGERIGARIVDAAARSVKTVLDEAGIEIPFPQRTPWSGHVPQDAEASPWVGVPEGAGPGSDPPP